MRYAVIMLLVAGCTSQPLDIGTAVVIYPDVPAVGVSVDHTRPAPVEHASAYLEIKGHYLELGVWENTDDTLIAVARQPEPPEPVRLPISRRPSTPIPSDLLRRLVETYMLPADVDLMLRVAWCESGYNINAKNRSSTASGLYQHLKGWWSGAWGVTGPFDPFNPEQSVKAAAALLYETSSGISNWNASKHCWW